MVRLTRLDSTSGLLIVIVVVGTCPLDWVEGTRMDWRPCVVHFSPS